MNATLTIYNALQDLLTPGVTIYAMLLPPDAVFPCVVYAQIFGGDGINVSGNAGSTYHLRYQVDIYHPTFAGLMELRALLVAGFHRYAADGILDTRIDLDLPYIVDELDTAYPNLYRHILDIGVEADRASA